MPNNFVNDTTIIGKIVDKASKVNNASPTVKEEVAIIAAIEALTTAITLGDVYLNASLLQKIKIKTSSKVREDTRVRLETLYLASLLGIDIGVHYFNNVPSVLSKDKDKVISVLFKGLVRRGLNLLDVPNLVVNFLK